MPLAQTGMPLYLATANTAFYLATANTACRVQHACPALGMIPPYLHGHYKAGWLSCFAYMRVQAWIQAAAAQYAGRLVSRLVPALRCHQRSKLATRSVGSFGWACLAWQLAGNSPILCLHYSCEVNCDYPVWLPTREQHVHPNANPLTSAATRPPGIHPPSHLQLGIGSLKLRTPCPALPLCHGWLGCAACCRRPHLTPPDPICYTPVPTCAFVRMCTSQMALYRHQVCRKQAVRNSPTLVARPYRAVHLCRHHGDAGGQPRHQPTAGQEVGYCWQSMVQRGPSQRITTTCVRPAVAGCAGQIPTANPLPAGKGSSMAGSRGEGRFRL